MKEIDCEAIVIESVCEDGRRFRPSDWIERLSAMLASYGPDHRLHYANSVHPGMFNGAKCLIVEKTLAEENPAMYEQIVGFARSNNLRMQEYCKLDFDHTGT